MSGFKVLPSYTDLTSFTLAEDVSHHPDHLPLLLHAQVGGDRLVDLDHDIQVIKHLISRKHKVIYFLCGTTMWFTLNNANVNNIGENLHTKHLAKYSPRPNVNCFTLVANNTSL